MNENVLKERYCPACNNQVIQEDEQCPSCKKVLYKAGRPKWFASIIGYLWGFLWGIIAAVIFAFIIIKVIKSDSKFLETLAMVVGGVVFFTLQSAKRTKLLTKKDLAIWRDKVESNNSVSS